VSFGHEIMVTSAPWYNMHSGCIPEVFSGYHVDKNHYTNWISTVCEPYSLAQLSPKMTAYSSSV
jgi:hypothetical protein